MSTDKIQLAANGMYPESDYVDRPHPSLIDHNFKQSQLQIAFIAGAQSLAAKEYWEEQGWVSEDMPKDGTVIQRWHKLWNCPVSVKYIPNMFEHEWIEATLTHSWPNESFTNYWRSLPSPPGSTPTLSKEAEYRKALDLAQAELRAMYKRVGIKGSNVLTLIDDALNKA